MKRFVGIVFAALSLALSAVFVTPATAFAHDEVVSTTPADGADIAPGSIKVAVTFGEKILDIPPHQGLAIRVGFPGGSSQTLDCVDVNGDELAGAVDATEIGTYTVDWRSVSSDGHENSGSFSFNVAAGAKTAEKPDATSECLSATPTADPNELDLTTYSPTAAATSGSKLDPLAGLGIGIGLVVVLSVLGALTAEIQKRRRARKAELKKLKAEVEANPDMLRDL